jgi:hypothetical protein
LPVAPRERAARAGKKTLDKLIGQAELHAAPATGATFAMAFATGDMRRHDRRRSDHVMFPITAAAGALAYLKSFLQSSTAARWPNRLASGCRSIGIK